MCKAIENLKKKCLSDGFNNGIHKEKESIALKMIQEGFSLDTICHLTNLSISHLEKLQTH